MAENSEILYIITQVSAYHIQDGVETPLNPSGPQNLQLSRIEEFDRRGELDVFLELDLPPELSLRLPATTKIFPQRPRSYLIAPGKNERDGGGAFIRLEFPQLGRGILQDDIDTFESILAAYTSFMERSRPPAASGSGYGHGNDEKRGSRKGDYSSDVKGAPPAYNPQDFQPGEAYAYGTGSGDMGSHGQVLLIDQDNGSVVGELAEDAAVVDDSAIKPGEKDPVEITVSSDGKRILVKPLSESYLEMSRMPAYQSSSLVQNAAAASRLIVTTSDSLARMMTAGAEKFQASTKPQNPVMFNQATHQRVRKINEFTASARSLSSKTVGKASEIAQNVGAAVARRKDKSRAKNGEDIDRLNDEEYKPGLLNRSMIAFSTLVDGIAVSGKHILDSGGVAATSMVGYRYGDDAKKVAAELTKSVTNVGLVYIDVTGVSRRAVIKSVAKGMLIGKVKGGGEVVVGEGDGGEIPQHVFGSSTGEQAGSGGEPPKYTPGDYKPSAGSGNDMEKYM